MTTTTSRTRRRAPSGSKNGGAVAVPHLSVADRVVRGKAARAEVPRSRHAVFEPSPDRVDPVTLLERQAETRVPELVPIRYGRMLVSPFTFYRGAAMIMAQDLGPTPRSGLNVQCCGDAHLSNFGAFASPERRLVFDVNDFDETLPGPWEWDVKRLAVSMLIAARDNGYRTKTERIVLDTVARYRTAMAEFAGMKNLDVWYSRLEIESVLEELAPQFKQKIVKRAEQGLAKSYTKDSMTAFSKLTESINGDVRIVDQSPLIVPIEKLAQGHERDEMFEALPPAAARLSRDARVRPTGALGGVRVDRLRAQGSRRRECRHPRVDRAAAWSRRPGPPVPADEGGRGVGARGVPRPERVLKTTASRVVTPGSALCRPPATSSSAGCTSRARGSTRSRATSTAASSRTGRARRRSSKWIPKAMATYGDLRRLDARACARPQRRPDRNRVLPRQRRSFYRAILEVQRPTPSRTNAITRGSRRQSSPARSRPRRVSDA